MAKLLQTRSLHRGLDVLDELANGPASLQKLHEQTGLSKSTLRRLLATLVDRRYIRRGISDNIYRTNVAIPTSAFGETAFRYGRLVEVARPYMMQLTEAVKWPSDLHVYHDGRMQILESTHGLSPFENARAGHTDSELNMFVAASGIAFLSSLESTEVAKIFEFAKLDDRWSPARFGITLSTLAEELNNTRSRGFASRRMSQMKQDNRSAIAVTISQANRAIGAITLIWRRDYMSVEEFGKKYSSTLIETAHQIGKSV